MASYSLYLLKLCSLCSVIFSVSNLVACGAEEDAGRDKVILNRASEQYLAMIFLDYSSNVSGRIPVKRFKDLLVDLNLGVKHAAATMKQAPTHEHQNKRRSRVDNQQQTEGKDLQRRAKLQRRKRKDEKHPQPGLEECLNENDLMRIHEVNKSQGLSKSDFVRICPALIRQLEEGACVEEAPSIKGEDHEHSKMLHVWGYGVLSITVISLTSLLAIAIIPLIGRSIYANIMSFLVALAVGTLAGDALLHLIPHALLSEGVDKEQRRLNIFKSCVIMVGIYLFFLVENYMKARLARKKNRKENQHTCDDIKSPEKMNLTQKRKHAAEYQAMVGSRLAGMQRCISCDDVHFIKVSGDFPENSKHELTPSCDFVNVESGKEERASNPSESSQERVPLWDSSCHGHHCPHQKSLAEGAKYSLSDTELMAAVQGKTCIHPNVYTNNNFTASLSESGSQEYHHVNQIHHHRGNQHSCPSSDETAIGIISDETEHEVDDHHHHHRHHHHSHSINKGTSIATVAWMVIVGDGFHNFSDGLAVGAAFSGSLTQGLTTAIAVFCHELPHELGDFAILIKSGLTFKQALAYNMASAITAYIGLVLGIIIGDIHSAHTWVLVLTAGMFLYISLVDMLPELGNYVTEGGGWSVVISQNIGLLTGVAIMLTIALYEKH